MNFSGHTDIPSVSQQISKLRRLQLTTNGNLVLVIQIWTATAHVEPAALSADTLLLTTFGYFSRMDSVRTSAKTLSM